MTLFTITDQDNGQLVCGSPRYPMWGGDEPDIYACQQEYTEEAYQKIRAEADGWRIDLDCYQEIDHGYDQSRSDSSSRHRPIRDGEILVKDGAFYGIVAMVDRRFRGKSYTHHHQLEYVSIDTAQKHHGLWVDHSGYSSDNGSGSDDTIYYLHPLK